MALALEKGKMPKNKASKKVKELSKNMSKKELEKFAKTKHAGLEENYILNFTQFINEKAYIDSSGKLQDFEFSSEEKHEQELYNEMIYISNFLEDSGANHIDFDYFDGIMKFSFRYAGESYEMTVNIDSDYGTLIRYSSPLSKGEDIYDGSAESLFDLLKNQGLSFL